MRWEVIYQLSPLLTLTVYGQPVFLAMLMEPKAQVLVPRKNVVRSLAMRRYQLYEDLRENGALILGTVTLAPHMLMDQKAQVLVPRKYEVRVLEPTAVMVCQLQEHLRELGVH